MKTFPEYSILVCFLFSFFFFSAVINTITKRNWKWEETRAVAQGRNLEAGINVKQWRSTACWLALHSCSSCCPIPPRPRKGTPYSDIDPPASILNQENVPKVLLTAQSDGGNSSSLDSFFMEVCVKLTTTNQHQHKTVHIKLASLFYLAGYLLVLFK